MNPWALLIAASVFAAATGGAYWQGRKDGKDSQLAEAVRDEAVAAIASEAAASAIAAAIPRITVKHQTIRQELEREIINSPTVYRPDCSTGPGSLQRFNSAIPGAASAPSDNSPVPAKDASN